MEVSKQIIVSFTVVVDDSLNDEAQQQCVEHAVGMLALGIDTEIGILNGSLDFTKIKTHRLYEE